MEENPYNVWVECPECKKQTLCMLIWHKLIFFPAKLIVQRWRCKEKHTFNTKGKMMY